jgi:uncharacterized protein
MKIAVFGASGMVGKQVVEQALNRGHHVRAFGRNVENFIDKDLRKENFEAIKGYVFDESDIAKAIKGCDAVVSVLGGDTSGADKTRSIGMKNIVAQMSKLGVARLIGLGGMGILQADEAMMLKDTEQFPKEYLPVTNEHFAAYQYMANSALQWTFVCPPNINNDGVTGAFAVQADFPPTPNKYHVNAGDLALFILMELEENRFVEKRVGISAS